MDRISCIGGFRFEEDLLDYLGHYDVPRETEVWTNMLRQMRRTDFSDARCLGRVASVPGYHRGANVHKYVVCPLYFLQLSLSLSSHSL